MAVYQVGEGCLGKPDGPVLFSAGPVGYLALKVILFSWMLRPWAHFLSRKLPDFTANK